MRISKNFFSGIPCTNDGLIEAWHSRGIIIGYVDDILRSFICSAKVIPNITNNFRDTKAAVLVMRHTTGKALPNNQQTRPQLHCKARFLK